MQILVNDRSIDFQLEKTLTLPELLEKIQEWASKENMFILDYLVDGAHGEDQTGHLNSDNILKLEVIIGNKYSLIWENLLETESYISKLINYLVPKLQDTQGNSPVDKAVIYDGFIWVCDSYESIKKHFKPEELNNFTKEYISDCLEKENYVLLLNFLSVVMENVRQWKKKVFYIMLDTSEIDEIKNIYLSELTPVLESLDTIASNFTVGKDFDALSGLENIIEWISIGLMVFEKSGTPEEKIGIVKNILNELNESLSNQDFVTLADIIDFDLRDALNDILITNS